MTPRLFNQSLAFSQPILEGSHASLVAGDEAKLRFYGLFKQVSAGDCTVPRPAESTVAAAKWDAWSTNLGLSRWESMLTYVTQRKALAPGWSASATVAAAVASTSEAPR